jgi:DNA repair protein RadC
MKQLSFLPGEMTPHDRRLISGRSGRWTGTCMSPAWPSPPPAVREWLRLHMAALEREGVPGAVSGQPESVDCP